MKIKLSKSQRQFLINSFIICLLLSIGIIFFLKIFLPNKSSQDIATTVAGILGTTFSFLGSVLVYLALRAQIDANEQVRKQFEKQNIDQIFFKLVDNLHNRVTNYSIHESYDLAENPDKKSYQVLMFLVNQIKSSVDRETKVFARQFLCNFPETVDDKFYKEISYCYVHSETDNNIVAQKIKSGLIKTHRKDRLEFLKVFLNSNNFEDDSQLKILKKIGTEYFYKTEFNQRKFLYEMAFDEVYQNHGAFLDGYLSNLKYLLNYIDNLTIHKDFYFNYLKNNVTAYERVVLFYYLAKQKDENKLKQIVIKSCFLDNLFKNYDLFFDSPSEEEFNEELNSMLIS